MEVVWGVIWMLTAGLTGTGYFIYYIMRMAYLEMKDERQEPERSES